MLVGLGIAVIVLLADVLSKYFILRYFFGEAAYVSFGSFFNIVRAWNTGVSFSMFNNYGHWGIYILSAVAVVIVLMLFHWLKYEKSPFIQVALGMIMGGALGNVIDRLRFGAVFDFLDIHIGDSHWPAFNVADSFICVGATLIIVKAIWDKFKERKAK